MMIREAGMADIEPLFNIWMELVKEEIEIDNDFKDIESLKEVYARYIRSFILRENHIVFIAIEKGEIIGFIAGKITKAPPVFVYEKKGYISDLFVKREHRRRGIGCKLMETIEKWFKGRGIDRVFLDVYAANEYARHFYKKRGFCEYSIYMKKAI